MLFSRRRFHLVAWSILNIENWLTAILARVWRRKVNIRTIRFRNGLQFTMDINAGDLQFLYEIFGERFYDRYFQGIVSDGTILDIGSNIGTFAVRAARDLVPRGRVIAIEPNPHCISLIKEHLKMNHLSNVEMMAAAVSNEGVSVALHVPVHRGGSTIFAHDPGNLNEVFRAIEVPAIRAKDVLHLAESFELVKVDCEGGEFSLLYETEPQDWINIKRLALEYHIGFDDRYPVSPQQLRERVEQLGLKVLALKPTSKQYGYLIAARA